MRAKLGNLLYRTTLLPRGPACWHWRHYGFDYAAQRSDSGWDVRVLGKQLRLSSLRAWSVPTKTLHIVLSGPSVGSLRDPARLALAPTITVNGSFRSLQAAGRCADLYLISDVGFVRRQWDSLLQGIAAARAVAADHRVVLEIARRDMRVFERVPFYLFDNVQRPYRRSAHWWSESADRNVAREGRARAFSRSFDWGYFPSCTVAYIGLQIAASMRPRRIVIFGMDLRDGRRFYAEARQEQSMIEQDLHAHIIPDFSFAAGVLRKEGIEVLNASPDSAMPENVFAKIDPDAYLATLEAAPS